MSAVLRFALSLLALVAGLGPWPGPAQAATYPFALDTVREGNSARLVARNRGPVPLQLRVTLTELANASPDRGLPLTIVVRPFTTPDVLRLQPTDPHLQWSYRFHYTVQLGDPGARHDDTVTYRLPFQSGQTFRISQAFGGPVMTHVDAASRHAVDIPMPEGTTIVAARAGYIVDVARQYDAGRLDPEYLERANSVTIFHDDGTWAVYAHLLRYTSNVYPGQRVQAGTPIGLSGNSGFSSGPHLHFVVQRNTPAGVTAVPILFETRSRGAFSPRFGDEVAADEPAPAVRTAGAGNVASTADAAGSLPPGARPRTLKACMAGRTVIDDAVLGCMGRR